jgi:excisionase family DNA binding protein
MNGAGQDEIRLAVALTPGEVERIARRAAELVTAGRRDDRAPRYMTVLEAADYLRCSRQRVYDLLSQGAHAPQGRDARPGRAGGNRRLPGGRSDGAIRTAADRAKRVTDGGSGSPRSAGCSQFVPSWRISGRRRLVPSKEKPRLSGAFS